MTLETDHQTAQAAPRLAPRTAMLMWAYLALITLAEVTTVLVKPIVGVVFHSLILAGLVTHAALVDDPAMRRLLLPLTLAPLTRILSITMPLTVLPEIYWYPIIYLPLAIGAFIVMQQAGLGRRDVGLTPRIPAWQIGIIPLGLWMGLIEFVILRPSPVEKVLTTGSIIFGSVIFIVTTGFVEELIFRGVLQKVMKDRFGWTGVVYTSILFTVLHLGFLSVADLLYVFAIAMFFAWLVNKTGSLLGVTLLHGLNNVGLYVIFPFLLPHMVR